jgi:hypothetical protein
VQTRAAPGGLRRVGEARAQGGQDVWGNELLRSPSGPTYLGAARHLRPLLLAARSTRRYLTRSGMYYLPFAWPTQFGAHNVALHVADGSGIFANVTRGRKLTINVGRSAGERFGSCLSRLSTPQLADGYLPILETRYVDGRGVPYRQESFSTVNRETGKLLSFVRVTADTTARTRPRESDSCLRRAGWRCRTASVVRGRNPQLFVSLGWQFDGKGVTYEGPAWTARDRVRRMARRLRQSERAVRARRDELPPRAAGSCELLVAQSSRPERRTTCPNAASRTPSAAS